jgi:ActR/RegA family two-component response regulator
MSDGARTVLIVTDDPCFSALISELMLRAGVQTIRFAQTHEALKLTRHFRPALVLIHMARGNTDAGYACYEMIQSDAALAHISLLLYTQPIALAKHAMNTPAARQSTDQLNLSDMLIAQITPLLGVLPTRWQHTDASLNEYAFPRGRDDL